MQNWEGPGRVTPWQAFYLGGSLWEVPNKASGRPLAMLAIF